MRCSGMRFMGGPGSAGFMVGLILEVLPNLNNSMVLRGCPDARSGIN